MINSANICIFEGRMVRDPQYSTVQMGQDSVEKALFTIAVDRALSAAQRQKAKNGDQSVKTADFIPCSLLGAQVATLRQYFPVGKSIRVIGHYTEYQTTDQQTGQKKYGHMFEIDNIGFAVQDSKNLQQNGGQQAAPQQGYQQAPQQGYQPNTYQAPPQQGYQHASPQYQQPAQNFAMFDENESPF
jgi:single-stranded DNA-binding protein